MKARKMLEHPKIGIFLRSSLNTVFKDGYSFQDPHYLGNGPGVEIFFKDMTEDKSDLFAAAMRVMDIKISCPCGLTRQIDATFRAEIKSLKRMLIDISGVEPDEDKNLSVKD
jgi:hypothetical protein